MMLFYCLPLLFILHPGCVLSVCFLFCVAIAVRDHSLGANQRKSIEFGLFLNNVFDFHKLHS